MTKHQMNTLFVAVALLAVVAVISITNVRSNSPSTDPAIASPAMSLKELAVDIKRLAVEDFHDHSLVFARETKR